MTHTPAARPLLLPLVPVYRLGLALRDLQLRSGLKPVRRLKWPVVSIGNLSTGGSGKTPLTITLARALTVRGLHVDVLSRGYGRRRSALPLLVDPGGTPQEFGDEPLLIAREANVPVYVAAERYEAGLMAEADATKGAKEQVGVHLLDDGFQHRQLARSVDIVLMDRRDMEDRLLPAGNLRESVLALRRAHVLALPAEQPELERFFREYAPVDLPRWTGPVWRVRRYMKIPPIDNPLGGPVAAFCGIARPDQFFQGLESAGVRLASWTSFGDHHNYTATDLARLASKARDAGATALLTTEKDRIRLGSLASTLPALLPLQTVQLRIEIEDEDAAVDWLIHRLGLHSARDS